MAIVCHKAAKDASFHSCIGSNFDGFQNINKKRLTLMVFLFALGGDGPLWWQNPIEGSIPDGISPSNGRIEAERIESPPSLRDE